MLGTFNLSNSIKSFVAIEVTVLNANIKTTAIIEITATINIITTISTTATAGLLDFLGSVGCFVSSTTGSGELLKPHFVQNFLSFKSVPHFLQYIFIISKTIIT